MKRTVQDLTLVVALLGICLRASGQVTIVSTDQIQVASDQALPPDWPVSLSLPANARVLQMQIADGVVTVEFGPEILDSLSEVVVNGIAEEFWQSLTLAEGIESIRLICEGQLLSSYLPAVKMVSTPPASPSPPILPDGTAAIAGLSGKKITLGPSHGRCFGGISWYWQRSDPCGLGYAVLEDTNSIRLCQFLYQYLAQDGATVTVNRELNESNCCNSDTGLPWWQMCSAAWLKANGLPCSVWATYTGNCGAFTATDRGNDDVRCRPLFADYSGSDIYISCHTNAGGGGTATGTETFRDSAMEHPAHEANSLTLANYVQSGIVDNIRSLYVGSWVSRGVKDANGGAGEIRIPNRPAIMIELAFHDGCVGSNDAAYLTDNFFRSVAEWGVYKGVCSYFATSPTWGVYSDEFVSDTIPTTMISGQVYPVSITFRNRGVVWSEGRSFRLGAVGESDPFTGSTRFTISGEVRPGDNYTWNFNLTAPAPGDYVSDWQLLREGIAWFGAIRTKNIHVNSASDTESPTTPTNLVANAPTPLAVQLNWTASTDNVAVIGYDIRRDGNIIASSPTNSYTDNTVVAGTAYTYEVRAKDAAPNYSSFSNSANVTTPTPDTQAPSTPTNLVAIGTGPTSVQLNWTASTDNVAVTGYDIRRDGNVIAGSPTNTYTDNAVMANTAYTYEVRAKDAVPNYSGYSNSAVATTSPVPTVVFQDGFDGNLGNWTQLVQNYDYSTTVNHGTFAGSGAAYMGAGQADQMHHSFARPFAQGKAKGFYWDGRGGWQTGVCGWAYRQCLSLRDADSAAKMYIDNEFYSARNNTNYFYRLVSTGEGTHTAYATRDPGTDCNGAWITFETSVAPGAPGSSPTGTFTAKVTDRAGATSTTQNLTSDFFAWGFARITLGLGNNSANEGFWDDISLEATPPGVPTMNAPTVLSDTQIRWSFSPADNNHFGWDVADTGGAVLSPNWPNGGWLDHNASSWTEGGLAPNTFYSHKVRSWNGTLISQYSGMVSARTLSPAPGAGSVTPDNASPCAGSNVVWTAAGGFGAGKVEYYAYAWDANPTHTFGGGEPVWNSGTLALATATPGTWYLHVKGYNADNAANGTFDYSATATDCNVIPTVSAAVSRKTHDVAGDFDINVAVPNMVEDRSNGPTQIVVTFSDPIEGLGGLDTTDVSVSSGSVTGLSISGSQLTVDMSGVTNGGKLTISFPGIVSIGGATASTSTVCFGALIGDANGDGTVNIFDLVTVRNALNQAVSASNFRSDVTIDGSIDIFDLVTIRNVLNTSVPSCP